MKKLIKSIITSLVTVTILLSSSSIIHAESYIDNQNLISIVDPYIIETEQGYKIIREDELTRKVGPKVMDSLKTYLNSINYPEANQDFPINYNAVGDYHIIVLNKAGAATTNYWWGTRVTTYSEQVAINVRELGFGFSGDAGTLVSAISYADSVTWNKVSQQVGLKIDQGKYGLNIDINKWQIEVVVWDLW